MDVNERLESLYIQSKSLLIKDSMVSYTDLCYTFTELPRASKETIYVPEMFYQTNRSTHQDLTSFCSELDTNNSFAILPNITLSNL